MAAVDIQRLVRLTPELLRVPFERMWSSYDREAEVLYLSFKKPSHADDSVLSDDDVIVRYEGSEVVGITVLHASRRAS
jgi:uncharacterized protein YuzE